MLKQRVITALVLVALIGAILFALPPVAASAAFAVVAALAAWEWAGLMLWSQRARIAYAVIILAACVAISQIDSGAVRALMLAAAFWVLLVPAWLAYRWPLTKRPFAAALTGAIVVVPFWAALTILLQRGPWLLIAAMAIVWVADIAAYFAGRAFGRHKLAPNISPGKTWEGVAGAAIGVVVYAALLLALTPIGAAWSRGLVAGVAVAVALTALSIMGDLFESLAKRQAGIKDSSQLLPGHGGILDRVDSLTSTLPVVALLVGLSP